MGRVGQACCEGWERRSGEKGSENGLMYTGGLGVTKKSIKKSCLNKNDILFFETKNLTKRELKKK